MPLDLPPFIADNFEIIAAGSIIVALIVLYLIIKKRTTAKKSLKELNDYSDIELIDDIYDTPVDPLAHPDESQENIVVKDPYEETPSHEEQLPSAQQSSKEEPAAQTAEQEPQSDDYTLPSQYNPKSKTRPVEVPPHGKIVKEDFKEFAGLKILVAEDNLINQKVIDGLLNESGIEVTFANDGLETLSYLNNQKDFDIVLMDAHMPNMDGFEATRKIREHPEYEALPIIALSGDIASDDIRKMYESGMDAHLEKPLKMDALYDILYAFTKKEQPKESKQENMQLNSAMGIEISGGDESFYKEILKEFLNDYEHANDTIKRLLEEGKMKEADALLLDIIGITANIGADSVNSDAIEFKKALQNIKSGAYKEAFKKFYLSYKKLIAEIKHYLS